jgi:hypothetical protein
VDTANFVTRLEILEGKVEALDGLPARVGELVLQIAQLGDRIDSAVGAIRAEVRAVDEALRAEIRAGTEALRAEVRAGDEESRTFMRILHEEVIERIKSSGSSPGHRGPALRVAGCSGPRAPIASAGQAASDHDVACTLSF